MRTEASYVEVVGPLEPICIVVTVVIDSMMTVTVEPDISVTVGNGPAGIVTVIIVSGVPASGGSSGGLKG